MESIFELYVISKRQTNPPITVESLLTWKKGAVVFSTPHFCLFNCLSLSVYVLTCSLI